MLFKNRGKYLFFILTAILFLASCFNPGKSPIDGKWEQVNGKETIIFEKGSAKCLWQGRQTWAGAYKKINGKEYDITTGFVGVYTKPMRAIIGQDGVLTLKGEDRILATYKKKE